MATQNNNDGILNKEKIISPEFRENAIKEIDRRVRLYVRVSGEKLDTQARLNEYDKIRRDGSGTFWDMFVTDPINQSIKEFQQEFGEDDQAISGAALRERAELSKLLDVGAVWTDLDRRYGSVAGATDFTSLEKLFRNPETENYIIEQYVTPYARNVLARDKCENTVLSAAIGTVTKTLAGAVSNQVKAVYALSTSFALVTNQVAGLGSALLNMPVQNLASLLISRDLILDRIVKVANSIAKIATEMTAKDYPEDHPYWLRQEQRKLQQAEAKLGRIQTILENGGKFNTKLWLSAKKDIDSAADQLCGVDIDRILSGLSLRPLSLIGLAEYLKTLLSVLRRQQELRNALINSIVTFNSKFFELTRFENLFVPTVQTLRCRLVKISDQMDASIKQNQFFKYLLKEKEWCLHLKALSALMRVSLDLNLPTALNKFSGTTALQNAANSIVETLNIATVESVDASSRSVLTLGNRMILLAKQKAAFNFPAVYLKSIASTISHEVDRIKGADDPVSKLLNIFSSLVPTQAFEAVLIVNQLLSFAEKRNIKQFVEAIKSGNLADAFGVTGLKATIDQSVTAGLSIFIAGSIAGGGLFGEPLREALAVREAVASDSRAQLEKQNALNASNEAISENIENIQDLKEIARFNARLLEAETQTPADTNYLSG